MDDQAIGNQAIHGRLHQVESHGCGLVGKGKRWDAFHHEGFQWFCSGLLVDGTEEFGGTGSKPNPPLEKHVVGWSYSVNQVSQRWLYDWVSNALGEFTGRSGICVAVVDVEGIVSYSFPKVSHDWRGWRLLQEIWFGIHTTNLIDQEPAGWHQTNWRARIRHHEANGIERHPNMSQTTKNRRNNTLSHSQHYRAFECIQWNYGKDKWTHSWGKVSDFEWCDTVTQCRALAKHCHRSETDMWWGGSTIIKGNAKDKSKKALQIVQRILNEATFINTHILPHNVPCVEVRNFEGYGARWVFSQDASSHNIIFRGFLEPYRSEGHENGWKH